MEKFSAVETVRYAWKEEVEGELTLQDPQEQELQFPEQQLQELSKLVRCNIPNSMSRIRLALEHFIPEAKAL